MNILEELCSAVSNDLALLSSLHITELDESMIEELKELEFPNQLGLLLEEQKAIYTVQELAKEIINWPEEIPQSLLDDLAADFAGIYLNRSYGASPQESVWLDDDKLIMQEPMFEVRKCYGKHQLSVTDWRALPDDHLSYELQFLSYLLEQVSQGEQSGLEEAASFLDLHLLRWLTLFTGRVSTRCETDFYAGLMLLTDQYCEELRAILEKILDQPRLTEEDINNRNKKVQETIEPLQYMPGSAPSW